MVLPQLRLDPGKPRRDPGNVTRSQVAGIGAPAKLRGFGFERLTFRVGSGVRGFVAEDGREDTPHLVLPCPARSQHLSGRARTLLRTVGPADRAGAGFVRSLALSRDGRSYAYQYPQLLHDLYLATGLK